MRSCQSLPKLLPCLRLSLALDSALSTHKTSAMSSLIPAHLSFQASEGLEQGQKAVWVTDTGLASELVCVYHISLPWKVLLVFQTYTKPKTEWSSSFLLVTFEKQQQQQHCEMILQSSKKCSYNFPFAFVILKTWFPPLYFFLWQHEQRPQK